MSEDIRFRMLWTIISLPLFIMGLLATFLGLSMLINLVLISLFVGIIPVIKSALEEVKRYLFNIDLLMLIAATGAYFIGSYVEGAAIIILYNVAEIIEDLTVDRVKDTIKKITKMLPKVATVKIGNKFIEKPVEECKIGDIILVKPGERIPLDGTIISGYTTVDESSITGESLPISKGPGEEVFSGTLNLDGSIEVKVEKGFRDSTVNRIIKLVIEAKERKAYMESFVQKFAKFYTPFVLIIVLLVAFTPWLLLGEPLNRWIYRSLVVLIIACPSAFVISVPITFLIGLTKAMWNGLLVKGSIYLEELSNSSIVALDKTGTLTYGNLKVSEIISVNNFDRNEVLRLAAIVEMRSSHLIARAIVDEAKRRGLDIYKQDVNIEELSGKGVICELSPSQYIIVGNERLLIEKGVKIDTDKIEKDSKTCVFVALNKELIGIIKLEDTIKEESVKAIMELKKMNIKTLILTGDIEKIAKRIASNLSIDEVYYQLTPEDKVKLVKKLKEHGKVVMVGDGINDAPALAEADVGIAISKIGNDVAIDSADVIIMNEDTRNVPHIIKLAKKVKLKQKINLVSAFILKAMMMILGILGLLPLWLAVIGDDGITILLVLNSLTILND